MRRYQLGIAVLLGVALLVAPGGCTGTVTEPGAPGPGPGPGIRPGIPDDPEFVPAPTLVRKLTRDEYLNTVSDVIGASLSADDANNLPIDRPLAGFVNVASGQTVAPEHVRAYNVVAEAIVADPAMDAFLASHAGCTDATTACGQQLVDAVGPILLRRPLELAEAADFSALFDAATGHGADYERAADAVVQAMLQSPQFLYLLEVESLAGVSGLREVGGYEMASRLSYLLWASAPDDALYAAAESGALGTPEGILSEVDRMLLEDNKLRRVIDRFLLDWALLEALPDDDGLRQELTDSAIAFYTDHVEGGGSLFDLLTAQRAFLTPALANAYGVPSQGAGIQPYDLSAFPDRLGLLAQPGVIAGMTNADGGEIVARGLFLQRQLFCGEPPDPPATLQGAIDEFIAEQPADASQRQIAETRLLRAECSVCHSQFDPLAYGFESFDFRGAYRTEDEFGNALQTDGWIPGGQNDGVEVPYDGLGGYMAELAQLSRVRNCLVQRQAEYALGAQLDDEHAGSIADLTATLAEGGGDYQQLVRSMVVHDLFRLLEME